MDTLIWNRFINSSATSELKNSLLGLEKESLRVDKKGNLAKTPHPKVFGSKLTNPNVTTDFAEAQVEMMTPTFSNEEDLMAYLMQLQKYILENLNEELLWPYSGPCILPDEIPVADFGPSARGKEKTLYRIGLGNRYGRKMQTLSGVHFNYSFSKGFWKKLYKEFPEKKTFREFTDACYLKIIRNFLHMGWLCTYLFGSSPAVDKTYIVKKKAPLKLVRKRTYIGRHATSLRMSVLGYFNKTECQKHISFSSIKKYVKGLQYAISTPCKSYGKWKKEQLNDHIFQIEAEHYTQIRPKPPPSKTHLQGIEQKGIAYIEIRNMDIHPFCFCGIEKDQLYFLQVFLAFCLCSEDRKEKNSQDFFFNQNEVALYGRKKNLLLHKEGKKIFFKDWAEEIIDKMFVFAELFDQIHETDRYTNSLYMQMSKIQNQEKTPSHLLLSYLEKENCELVDFLVEDAKKFKKESLSLSYSDVTFP